MTLSWDTVTNAAGYTVCHATESIANFDNCTSYANGALEDTNGAGLTLSGLTNGTAYHFRVIAGDVSGNKSPVSSEVTATPNKANLNAGLIAHYEFENNANDTSGKGNHGNELGGVTYVNGIIGQAASFDGLDDTIKIEHNNDIDFNMNDSYSISIYINYTEDSINDDSSILEKWGDILPSPYPMVLRTTKSNVYFAIHDHYEGSRPIVDITSVERENAPPNYWHHIVVVKSASESIKMYVNGSLVSTDSDIEVKNITSRNPLYIGSRGNDSNSYAIPLWYKGLVDDLRIYNRALSESEVKALYQSGGGGSGATGKLNDTGITTCSNATQNNLPCPQADFPGQDAESGRDANQATNNDADGHRGFSFTKISSTGTELPASATEWSCVKDNVTGLIWEVKTDDGGLHDKDWTYSWYEPDGTKNGGSAGTQGGGSCVGSQCDTYAYVQAVNTAGWCGAKNWRMPTKRELYSIVTLDRHNPTIDIIYFPNTSDSWFWSSSLTHIYNSNIYAWCVLFDAGGNGLSAKESKARIRLVRSGQ